MNENQKIPRIRFKGFTDTWEQRELGEFFKKYQNTVYLDDETSYVQVSVRNTGIVEYRDEKKGIQIGRKRQYKIDTENHPDTLVFTRQTVYEGGIGFVPKTLNGAIVTENMPLLDMNGMSKKFVVAFVRTKGYYSRVIDDNTLIGSAQKALHEKLWLASKVIIPKEEEQEKIGCLFEQLDNLITLHQRKYDKLVATKKALLEKMFPRDGATVPEIRFKGFTDAWEQRELGEMAIRISEMSDEPSLPRVEYEDINAGQGTLNKDLFRKASTKKGQLFHDGDVLYGKLRPYLKNWLKSTFLGIAVGDFWVLRSKLATNGFIYTLIQSSQFERAANQTTGTKMPRADWGLLSKMQFSLPLNRDEQEQISTLFLTVDNLITLHQRKLEKLKNIKKSLLEKMFV